MKHLKLIVVAVLFATVPLTSQTDSTNNKPQDTEQLSPFQFTFVTPVGTNGQASFKSTNRVSLNLLMGVARGLKGFEAGGIANVILKDAEGAQFAGTANIVLGNMQGAQFASSLNYCGKDFRGVAFAGSSNINMGALKGTQVSAFFNFTKKGGSGAQIAAYANIALNNFNGVQVACASNIVVGDIQGAQLSTGINIAKKVKGVQVGFINIADSVDGATIGFFNFVKKGKHQVELSGDELFYGNISFRTGSEAFFNIFTAGFSPGTKNNLWQFGYGAGTSFKLKNKLWGDISLTAHHVNTGSFYLGTSELFRLYCGVEYRIAKKIALAAGPTFNLYITDVLLPDYADVRESILPYYSYNYTNSWDFNTKGWIGGRLALRFL